jgi:Family of unknown function (DUF6508)
MPTTSSNSFSDLESFIPLFEAGIFKEASSLYVSTGEYLPQATDLLAKLRASNIALADFDWLTWVAEARPYLQNPSQIASASFDDVAKLTTIAIHSDKFNKSLFPHLCSSGFLHQLLLRIRALAS